MTRQKGSTGGFTVNAHRIMNTCEMAVDYCITGSSWHAQRRKSAVGWKIQKQGKQISGVFHWQELWDYVEFMFFCGESAGSYRVCLDWCKQWVWRWRLVRIIAVASHSASAASSFSPSSLLVPFVIHFLSALTGLWWFDQPLPTQRIKNCEIVSIHSLLFVLFIFSSACETVFK